MHTSGQYMYVCCVCVGLSCVSVVYTVGIFGYGVFCVCPVCIKHPCLV